MAGSGESVVVCEGRDGPVKTETTERMISILHIVASSASNQVPTYQVPTQHSTAQHSIDSKLVIGMGEGMARSRRKKMDQCGFGEGQAGRRAGQAGGCSSRGRLLTRWRRPLPLLPLLSTMGTWSLSYLCFAPSLPLPSRSSVADPGLGKKLARTRLAPALPCCCCCCLCLCHHHHHHRLDIHSPLSSPSSPPPS